MVVLVAVCESALRESALRESALCESALCESTLYFSSPQDSDRCLPVYCSAVY